MMNAGILLAKLIISSGLLYGYYYLFLRNQRFHHYNRFYLLAVTLIALIIPFLNIPVNLFNGGHSNYNLIKTLKVITAGSWEEPVIIYAHHNQWSNWITLLNSLYLIYLAGLLIGLIVFIRSLYYINRLRKKYQYEKVDQLKVYSTTEPGTPFSFFTSIFWDKRISLHEAAGQQIFKHEMFHVKEKHSADILMMELLCCVCWFNPFFHLIKKELRAIHEFLADEYAVSLNNRYDYAELLVLHAISNKAASITHPFFHNQIKRRIKMITQSSLVRRSGYISRIMALPLLFVLISAFTIKFTGKISSIAGLHRAGKNITVVIDPGHGGIYAGSQGANGILEKDIDLAIARQVKQLAAQYNVNIILTRNTDALVGNASNLKEDLENRLNFQIKDRPDLFISIHVNASNEKTTTRTGFQAYISNKKEDSKARILASTILLSIKSIYPVEESIQQRKVGIYVLDKNIYPAMILHCGYINNVKDLAFISNVENQEKLARKILEGIVQYENLQTTGSTVTADMLSPEEIARLDVNDIKKVDAFSKQNFALITMKNGDEKSVNLKQLHEYYTTHPEQQLDSMHVSLLYADSVHHVNFLQDTLPGRGTHPADKIFTKVEVEAGYPGGQKGWADYLIKTLRYPAAAEQKKIQGTVLVEFIVDTLGKLSSIKAISGPAELQQESIRVIKHSGVWESAKQNGVKVKSYKIQPITYRLA